MAKWIMTLLVLALFVSCDQVERGGNEMPTKDIRVVLDAHSAEILAIPGVTGVFISELNDKTPCILVMVADESPELAQKIPDTLEGHPVKIVVSEEFRPMDGQQSPG